MVIIENLYFKDEFNVKYSFTEKGMMRKLLLYKCEWTLNFKQRMD